MLFRSDIRMGVKFYQKPSTYKTALAILDKEKIMVASQLAGDFTMPKDKTKRAWARSIAAEMHAGFQTLRSNCPMDVKAKKQPKANPPELQKDIERIKTIWGECRRAHKKDGEFLFGGFGAGKSACGIKETEHLTRGIRKQNKDY